MPLAIVEAPFVYGPINLYLPPEPTLHVIDPLSFIHTPIFKHHPAYAFFLHILTDLAFVEFWLEDVFYLEMGVEFVYEVSIDQKLTNVNWHQLHPTL